MATVLILGLKLGLLHTYHFCIRLLTIRFNRCYCSMAALASLLIVESCLLLLLNNMQFKHFTCLFAKLTIASYIGIIFLILFLYTLHDLDCTINQTATVHIIIKLKIVINLIESSGTFSFYHSNDAETLGHCGGLALVFFYKAIICCIDEEGLFSVKSDAKHSDHSSG